MQNEELTGCCQKFKLQEFAIQRNDSDMLGVISQAKVFVESQAAKRVNCMQKTLLDYWKKYRKTSKFLDLRPTTPKHEMFYHFKSHLSM